MAALGHGPRCQMLPISAFLTKTAPLPAAAGAVMSSLQGSNRISPNKIGNDAGASNVGPAAVIV